MYFLRACFVCCPNNCRQRRFQLDVATGEARRERSCWKGARDITLPCWYIPQHISSERRLLHIALARAVASLALPLFDASHINIFGRRSRIRGSALLQSQQPATYKILLLACVHHTMTPPLCVYQHNTAFIRIDLITLDSLGEYRFHYRSCQRPFYRDHPFWFVALWNNDKLLKQRPVLLLLGLNWWVN